MKRSATGAGQGAWGTRARGGGGVFEVVRGLCAALGWVGGGPETLAAELWKEHVEQGGMAVQLLCCYVVSAGCYVTSARARRNAVECFRCLMEKAKTVWSFQDGRLAMEFGKVVAKKLSASTKKTEDVEYFGLLALVPCDWIKLDEFVESFLRSWTAQEEHAEACVSCVVHFFKLLANGNHEQASRAYHELTEWIFLDSRDIGRVLALQEKLTNTLGGDFNIPLCFKTVEVVCGRMKTRKRKALELVGLFTDRAIAFAYSHPGVRPILYQTTASVRKLENILYGLAETSSIPGFYNSDRMEIVNQIFAKFAGLDPEHFTRLAWIERSSVREIIFVTVKSKESTTGWLLRQVKAPVDFLKEVIGEDSIESGMGASHWLIGIIARESDTIVSRLGSKTMLGIALAQGTDVLFPDFVFDKESFVHLLEWMGEKPYCENADEVFLRAIGTSLKDFLARLDESFHGRVALALSRVAGDADYERLDASVYITNVPLREEYIRGLCDILKRSTIWNDDGVVIERIASLLAECTSSSSGVSSRTLYEGFCLTLELASVVFEAPPGFITDLATRISGLAIMPRQCDILISNQLWEAWLKTLGVVDMGASLVPDYSGVPARTFESRANVSRAFHSIDSRDGSEIVLENCELVTRGQFDLVESVLRNCSNHEKLEFLNSIMVRERLDLEDNLLQNLRFLLQSQVLAESLPNQCFECICCCLQKLSIHEDCSSLSNLQVDGKRKKHRFLCSDEERRFLVDLVENVNGTNLNDFNFVLSTCLGVDAGAESKLSPLVSQLWPSTFRIEVFDRLTRHTVKTSPWASKTFTLVNLLDSRRSSTCAWTGAFACLRTIALQNSDLVMVVFPCLLRMFAGERDVSGIGTNVRSDVQCNLGVLNTMLCVLDLWILLAANITRAPRTWREGLVDVIGTCLQAIRGKRVDKFKPVVARCMVLLKQLVLYDRTGTLEVLEAFDWGTMEGMHRQLKYFQETCSHVREVDDFIKVLNNEEDGDQVQSEGINAADVKAALQAMLSDLRAGGKHEIIEKFARLGDNSYRAIGDQFAGDLVEIAKQKDLLPKSRAAIHCMLLRCCIMADSIQTVDSIVQNFVDHLLLDCDEELTLRFFNFVTGKTHSAFLQKVSAANSSQGKPGGSSGGLYQRILQVPNSCL